MTPENEAVEDLTGRVAVVTGANSGIGLAAALEFARRGWTLAIVGRDADRLHEALVAVREINPAATAHQCDFASLDAVRDLAAALAKEHPRIDVLANNAGGASPVRKATVDGFELTIQANHLAPFLLSNLLREPLRGGRIINTASDAHRGGTLDPDDLNSEHRKYTTLGIYGSAKQANILFAAEAARQWPDILSTSYHPGIVRTRFGRDSATYDFFYKRMPFLRTPEKGAETMIWLAEADRSAITNGAYYVDKRERRPQAKAADPQLAARLWTASLAATALTPA